MNGGRVTADCQHLFDICAFICTIVVCLGTDQCSGGTILFSTPLLHIGYTQYIYDDASTNKSEQDFDKD